MDLVDNLLSNAQQWIEKQGYPLELRVARAFRRAGFESYQSDLYLDRKTNQWREIDLVALVPDRIGVTRIAFSVECKSSSKPWVLFAADAARGESIYRTYALMSDKARKAISHADTGDPVDVEHPDRLPIFDRLRWLYKSKETAYSLRQAHSETDAAYTALLSSSKAASELLKADKYTQLPAFCFAFAVIVIDSPLLLCSLTEDETLEVKEVTSGEVLFRNPDDRQIITCIRVVTLQGLAAFLSEARNEVMQLKRELADAEAEEWRQRFNQDLPKNDVGW